MALGCLLLAPAAGGAQTPRDARLMLTVVDPSNGVIPGATVTLAGLDDATKGASVRPMSTSPVGVATFDGLAAGRYRIQAEFAGFEPGVLKDIRLRSGENRRAIVLALKKMEDTVTVTRDAQTAATDPRGAFRTILTREEINALSDDPAEMAQQLIDLAGGNAVFSIDGFTGGPLPPKAMIKSIHIVRDTFAAENHAQEFEQIAIVTQPGIGPFQGGATTRFRDGSMTGRSPFTPRKGPERSQNYQGNLGGTIVPERSSFAVSASRGVAFDTPNLFVALPDGTRAEALGLRRPTNTWNVHGLLDYALTRDHTLRASLDASGSSRRNYGVGAYDLPERAYGVDAHDGRLRLQQTGPVGRRLFLHSRVQLSWANTENRAVMDAPTIRVVDAFTSGGAQVRGGSHPREFAVASDLDYIRGSHSVRVGLLVEGGRYRSDDASNYLGTYLFTSRDAFTQGTPASYTRRVGNAVIRYSDVRAGVYLQDDLRLSKSLTLSPGLRYEFQTHVGDKVNAAPRLGATWAPFKSGRTTVRASYGVFYTWLNAGTYEQTLRVDGVRQQELIIARPSYPDPGPAGVIRASNRYLLGDVAFARILGVSVGVDQSLTPKFRLSGLFRETRQSDLPYGRNLNAPVGGVRPDAAYANVIETASGARVTTRQIGATLTMNLAAGVPTANQGRLNWRRQNLRLVYTLSRWEGNGDGPFAVSPSGSLDTEWGPVANDRRHRVTWSLNSQALRNLNATLSLTTASGAPYTITTGLDDNGDLIFNDRPAGVGRNSARTASQITWSLNAAYSMQIAKYRMSFTANATNLTNRANLTGYSGVMTSPFFRQATSVSNPRRIEFGVIVGF